MTTAAHVKVSLSLQELAGVVHDFLSERAGKPVSFVLMVNTDDVTQYISNTDRKDGVALVEALLERWKKGRADIPAHYNPDLRDGAPGGG